MNSEAAVKEKSKVQMMMLTALMTAVICVLSPFSIPIGPVPISLGTLALFLAAYVLGAGYGTVATILYLFIGFVGVPVFSNFSGGVGKLIGPTGGYLIGYIPMVLVAGIIVDICKKKERTIKNETDDSEKGKKYFAKIGLIRVVEGLGMVFAEVVLYVAGTAWFVYSTGTPLAAALSLCVIPFIAGDLIKIVIALVVAPLLSKGISR
ncbi:MAG: biotin transporter BioY [Eubacterium sp.]|nr:biotin transporter BioY [Eubacterium sp.]